MLSHLKTYLPNYLAAIAGIAAILAKADPHALGPLGAAIVGGAVTVGVILHALGYESPKPDVTLAAKAFVGALALSVLLVGVQGCVTTQAQRSTLAALTDAAVIVVVQQGNAPVTEQQARAAKIKQIATELQAVNNATVQSLPAVIAAVTPLIAAAGLNPAEAILAQQLVSALSMQLQAQLGANPQAAEVQTTVGAVLTDVIAATAAYGV